MKSNLVRAALFLLVVPHSAAAQAAKNAQLVEMVTRMAKIGRAASPTFSPDGTRIAFVSDRTGVPQVWVAAVDGGAPLQINQAGSCQYCNVKVTTGEFDWVLSRIEQDDVYDG